MNYTKHYDILIERAKHRAINGYTEKHHIVPRCLGGSNKKENIVSLTAREHYVAHQLLVKMNPNHHGLIKAAAMMANAKNINIQRFNNRLYEWLRIKHSAVMSESQTGDGNSQYGTKWIYNAELNESKKISKLEDIPDGWVTGRRNKRIICKNCGNTFLQTNFKIVCCGRKNINKNSYAGIGGQNRMKVRTPYGIFDSLSLAAGAENINVSTIYRRVMRDYNKEYVLVAESG